MMKTMMMMSRLSATFLAMMSIITASLLLFAATPARGFGVIVAPSIVQLQPMLITRTTATTTIHSSTTAASTRRSTRTSISSGTLLHAIRCENKYYQLEEMEDKDTCTTELFLNADRTTSFGPTDGPMPMQTTGSWQIGGDNNKNNNNANPNDFKMTIVRQFKAGDKHKDVGEFSYEVKRTYTGEMTMVGASVGITGVIENVVEDGTTLEVGFFNMIDATEEREGYGTMAVKMTSN